MSCFNLTGKPQTTKQAVEAKRKATEAAAERAVRIANLDGNTAVTAAKRNRKPKAKTLGSKEYQRAS